eukprot:CAMPEP_0181211088 /NCGR_PEP_ID=MMETSP1096-20121128/23594_1 /TAXON_ID=156174 ORGANISM="Chrysochromulina ericina, Strain CCMP281" /NCGR_SAMPLE_ID=MMETSP1096 /ASSEMBLY_ACC=CAM_ASM_000453 /LENGTH=96 /DNA_ID=CAMNT_0023302455 /DNA_START=145 /DNA_END=435 /DNA_ORIENTATION=-
MRGGGAGAASAVACAMRVQASAAVLLVRSWCKPRVLWRGQDAHTTLDSAKARPQPHVPELYDVRQHGVKRDAPLRGRPLVPVEQGHITCPREAHGP